MDMYGLNVKGFLELLKPNPIDFLAGWVGGIAGLVVGHPADTVKVREQTLGTPFMATVIKISKYEGPAGFFRGFMIPFLTIGPSNAVFFSTYASTTRILQKDFGGTKGNNIDLNDPKWVQHTMFAGLIAGYMQVLVTCPVELMKTVMQTNVKPKGFASFARQKTDKVIYKNSGEALLAIVNANGVSGLYKGFIPMVWRDVPSSAVFTLIYETLYPRGPGHQPLWKQILAGGLAGMGSWLITLPFDVIKSRIQGDNQINPKYKGMIDCIKKSYHVDGLRVFYKGGMLVALRAFPVNAAILVGYEVTNKELREIMK